MPLAAILWNGGISFGGVIAFIFADLIIIPILNIYRKYYGGRMALLIGLVLYAAMVVAALIVEFIFQLLHLVPTERNAQIVEASIQLNYTTYLNLVFLAVSAVLVWRFVSTGGLPMLNMMEGAPEQPGAMVDPVCGMQVDPATASEHVEQNGHVYYFCSAGCREEFERNPEAYVRPAAASGGHSGSTDPAASHS